MADSLGSNVSEKLIKKFAEHFEDECVLLKTIDTTTFDQMRQVLEA